MGFFSWLAGSSGQHDGSSPLDGHDGGLARDFTGKANGQHYIEGKASPQSKFDAICRMGKSGIFNGPDSAQIVPENYGITVQSEGYGQTILTEDGQSWSYDDYVNAQDTSHYDCGTGYGG